MKLLLKRIFLNASILLFCTLSIQAQQFSLIPYPEKLQEGKGSFLITTATQIYFEDINPSWKDAMGPLLHKLKTAAGIGLKEAKCLPTKNRILIAKGLENKNIGAYELEVNASGVTIRANESTGVFYAVQTLLQLMPPSIESNQFQKGLVTRVPAVRIEDAPALAYRGLMFDVSRHFLPLSFLKKLVDLMAMQKMNNLHLHLTDDQGWRMEIKKYPRLTSVGAFRNGTLRDKFPGKGNDNQPHGGYYTQQELKELVSYAAKRCINIVPEIELPGHSSALIAAYPALSCFPQETSNTVAAVLAKKTAASLQQSGTKIVQESWGVFQDVLCPTEFTFGFLQDVLDEVMEVFPSNYIHVGGDECPKDFWKRSDYCQQIIKQKNLKDEHGLQSYFIQRIEKYLNGKGRRIIGWDEILEGGLAPNATVMSWRGTSGGIEAAKQGHDVIMSPVDNCYLNLYQSDDASDSIAWGGMLPLKAVYNYEPIPSQLNEAEAVHVIGLQGNLWTEYINSPALAEFMLFPRASALAESGWRKTKTGFDDFSNRLVHFMARWDVANVNYSRHVYDIKLKGTYLSKEQKMQVDLLGVPAKQSLFYSINGSVKNPYTNAILVEGNSTVEAMAMLGGKVIDKATARFHMNKATGKSFILVKKPAPQYVKGGEGAWLNGVLGSDTRYTDEEWLGWNGDDFEGSIDFSSAQQMSKAIVRVFNNPNSWVYPPSSITVLGSADGLNFEELSRLETSGEAGMGAQTFELKFKPGKFRYLKIKATNHGIIGKGNPGAGFPAWLFLDEVVVE